MASVCKRRIVDQENRIFKESWTDQYFFIMHEKCHYAYYVQCVQGCNQDSQSEEAAVPFTIVITHGPLKSEETTASSASMLVTPLVCCCCQRVQLKTTLPAKHSEKFNSLTGDARKNKIESLRRSLTEQQGTFIRHITESDNNTRASFAVSELIGKRMKPFTDGEFVKDCLLTVVDIVCPEKRDLFADISFSARTVTRRIEGLASDIKLSLQKRAKQSELFSICTR